MPNSSYLICGLSVDLICMPKLKKSLQILSWSYVQNRRYYYYYYYYYY